MVYNISLEGNIGFSFHLSTYCKTSQVLSPLEEEELVKQLTKMGESGPIIFDRHFFNLVCFDVIFLKWTDHYCCYYDEILFDSGRPTIETVSITLSGSTLSGSPCLGW